LELAEFLPSAKQAPTVQLTFLIQRYKVGMNMWGGFIQVELGSDNPVAILFIKPVMD
jgi:hypothetical protein